VTDGSLPAGARQAAAVERRASCTGLPAAQAATISGSAISEYSPPGASSAGAGAGAAEVLPPPGVLRLLGPEPRCPFCGALAVKSESMSFASSMQRQCGNAHDWVTL